jgi:hypothetical protein
VTASHRRRIGLAIARLFAALPVVFLLLGSAPAEAERRALLIGISAYQHIPVLANPAIDIGLAGDRLAAAGYRVTRLTDPDTTRDKLVAGIAAFLKSIKPGDEIVVYYSGHGVDIDGDNLLVPADSPGVADVASAYALTQSLISLRPLMSEIEDHDPAVQVWIIDACRENPYAGQGRSFATAGGLTKLPDRTNSYVFYSAGYGQVARDGLPSDPPGSHLGSPFSRTFAGLFEAWKTKDIDQFARRVRQDVVRIVAPDPQFPIFENGILDEWCFATCNDAPAQIAEDNGPGAKAVAVSDPGAGGDPAAIPGPGAGAGPGPGPDTKAAAAAAQPAPAANAAPDGAGPATGGTAGPPSPDLPTRRAKQALALHRAVFIGRDSWKDCDPAVISPKFPFGCATLQRIAANRARHFRVPQQDRLAGKDFTVVAPVYVRRSGPLPGRSGVVLDCKLTKLAPGDTVRFLAAYAVRYANDVFYWATLPGAQPPCPEATVAKG